MPPQVVRVGNNITPLILNTGAPQGYIISPLMYSLFTHINGTVVEKVDKLKFLGMLITDKLKWSTYTANVVKKAQQHLFNHRRLKKCSLAPKTLTNFYRCTIESILSGCIIAWYGNCFAHTRRALQGSLRWPAQRITGGKLPALQDTCTTRCHRKAIKIIMDNNHLSHCLFTLLSSRR